MRILILGNNESAKLFFVLFNQNKDNIVFSTVKEKNFIEFYNYDDIIDFLAANEINFVLITDNKFIKQELTDKISSLDISVFAPDYEASEICFSSSYAKRFMYKNKINTPGFIVAEKQSTALEYIKQAHFPLCIKPDINNFFECPYFSETKRQAHLMIEKLFQNGNQKIVIDDYIEGKNISVWALSDGYSAKIIGINAKYQNDVSIFNPDFINNEIIADIEDYIIFNTINALSNQNTEYIGILGFDIILDNNNTPYLIGYNSFFDDISAPFFTSRTDINWLDIFESTLIGDVFSKYNFENLETFQNGTKMVTLRTTQGDKEEIELISANTTTNLQRYLNELGYDLKEYNETLKLWK